MAHLIPILQDIIPMIRPGKVQVVRPAQFDQGTGQTQGMCRMGAVVDMSGQLCASVMIAKPHTSSTVHHHGEQDTIVYAASGYGTIITNPSLTPPPPNMPSTTTAVSSPSIRATTIDIGPKADPNTGVNMTSASSTPLSNLVATEPTSTVATIPTSNPTPPTALTPSTPHSNLTSTSTSPPPLRAISPNPTTTSPTPNITSHPIQFPHRHLQAHQLSPGDFALIPAWTEHQEANDSEEDVVWIITRGGSVPVVVNLEGWGGREVRD